MARRYLKIGLVLMGAAAGTGALGYGVGYGRGRRLRKKAPGAAKAYVNRTRRKKGQVGMGTRTAFIGHEMASSKYSIAVPAAAYIVAAGTTSYRKGKVRGASKSYHRKQRKTSIRKRKR